LIDSLLHHDHHKLWVVVAAKVVKAFSQLWNFVLPDDSQLAVAHTIAEHKNEARQTVIYLTEQQMSI